jgi:predicted dehydrogenase
MAAKWGILGTGMIAGVFARALKAGDGTSLCAVASRDLSKAKAFAAEAGAKKAYGSYEALLADPKIRYVYIGLPNELHCEWALKAAEAGKHILCEKPMAVTVEEAQRMFAAAEEAKVLLMEAFMYRFHPQTARLREIVASGEIGDLRVIRSRFSFTIGDPKNVRLSFPYERGGGGLMDVGCYCTSFSRYLTQEEPCQVFGAAQFGVESGVDEGFVGTLTFPSGVLAVFDVGLKFHGDTRADLMGTKGSIEIPAPWKPGAKSSFKVRVGRETREEQFEGKPEFVLEAESFQAMAEGLAEPMVRPEETLGNTKVLCALRESARRCEVIQL